MTSKGLRSSAGVFHDLVKFFVGRWGEGHHYSVEFEAVGEGEKRPDVVLRYQGRDKTRAKRVYVEVQKDLSRAWYAKIGQHYEGECLVILDLEKYNTRVVAGAMAFWVGSMYEALAQQLDNETRVARPKKPARRKQKLSREDDYRKLCGHCNKPFKKRNLRTIEIEGKTFNFCRKCVRELTS